MITITYNGKTETKSDMDNRTVAEIRERLGLPRTLAANLNGEPVGDSDTVHAFSFLAFAKAESGGR